MEREGETAQGKEATAGERQEAWSPRTVLGPGLPEDQVENPDFETRTEEK